MTAAPAQPLLRNDGRGIRCDAGGFHIDPWRPVPLALVTHAHADHARPGMGRYLCTSESLPILRLRLGAEAAIDAVPCGEPIELGETRVSFHPAGHCLGSAQVRVEGEGAPGGAPGTEVAVAAGDYKRAPDPSCRGFEPLACDTFVTEATFALPIYRWRPGAEVADEMLAWWLENRERGRVSVLCAYTLGKTQRVLAELAGAWDRAGPSGEDRPTVWTHGAAEPLVRVYREAGVDLLPTRPVGDEKARGRENPFRGGLVLAPPAAAGSPWMRRFGRAQDVDVGFVSGWMAVRGIRRRRGYDRGFVMSDHADWPDLVRTCRESGASRILCTHGNTGVLSRYLRECCGLDASPLDAPYEAEEPD